ncbi:hypothetical protein, partial [Flavobacterium sp. FlaQc-30]|uniref:hypothetical protein n=1 Tax=Flavobacterium sp. FlaQc-30 TaxID=3374179 RepID=UPI00375735F1
EAASYQTILDPDGTVAVAVRVCDEPVSHTVTLTGAVGAAGAAFMVNTTAVLVKLEQLPFDVCPYNVLVAAAVLTKVAGLTTLPPE